MPELGERIGDVALPHAFFQEILPRVSDLSELKLLLFVAYFAAERRQKYGVPLSDLTQPQVMRSIVGTSSPEPAEARLQRTMDKTVADGTIFRLKIRRCGDERAYFLPVSSANRELLDRLKGKESDASVELDLGKHVDVTVYRPNIFALYEQHLGPLNPLLAEQLRDAERSYPKSWIEQAIIEAVHYNKRNWRYVQTVLSQWEDSGGPSGISR
jgi:DNA replication protein